MDPLKHFSSPQTTPKKVRGGQKCSCDRDPLKILPIMLSWCIAQNFALYALINAQYYFYSSVFMLCNQICTPWVFSVFQGIWLFVKIHFTEKIDLL